MESLAQVGVQLLLFTLGLEFSLQKLRAVRSVALIGSIAFCPGRHFASLSCHSPKPAAGTCKGLDCASACVLHHHVSSFRNSIIATNWPADWLPFSPSSASVAPCPVASHWPNAILLMHMSLLAMNSSANKLAGDVARRPQWLRLHDTIHSQVSGHDLTSKDL